VFSKAGMATVLMLWQQVGCCNGLLRFCRNARTVPFLTLELRFRLNLRYWSARLSRLMFRCDGCPLFPFIFSGKFLLRRDGHNIFDFFKTLSLSDVSPPARA
jgi:hypothetical protein